MNSSFSHAGCGRLSTRREFLKQSAVGAAATCVAGGLAFADDQPPSKVAVVKGDDRADNAFRAMQFFKKEIAAAIGSKRIIVKPNAVWDTVTLACTHVDWLEGVLEFLKSIGRTDVTIGESNAQGGTMTTFLNMGYFNLQRKYPVKLMDLNQEGYELRDVWKDATTTWTIRVNKHYLDPNTFIISCPLMKTHHYTVATLSIKNISMSAPIVDVGMYPGEYSSHPPNPFQPGARGNKYGPPGMHGYEDSSTQVLNDNIYRMFKVHGVRPGLTVTDGYQGMQGSGPVFGYAVNPPQKLGIASLDSIAADRVCIALMGLDTADLMVGGNPSLGPYPAYASYLWQSGLGQWDIGRIVDVQTGAPITDTIADDVYSYQQSGLKDDGLTMRANPKE